MRAKRFLLRGAPGHVSSILCIVLLLLWIGDPLDECRCEVGVKQLIPSPVCRSPRRLAVPGKQTPRGCKGQVSPPALSFVSTHDNFTMDILASSEDPIPSGPRGVAASLSPRGGR